MLCAGSKSSKRGRCGPAISYKSKKSRPKSGPAEFRHLAFNLAYCRAGREHAASAPRPSSLEPGSRRPTMNAMPDAQLCHIGLYAFDLEKMVEFYSRIFGLVVTDRGHSGRGFEIAFLSRDPIEHHQIAIAAGRPKDAIHSTINQISFRVPGLEELRQYYPWLVKERVQKLDPRNHGNAWSIYFADPEGNRVELYCSSPWP